MRVVTTSVRVQNGFARCSCATKHCETMAMFRRNLVRLLCVVAVAGAMVLRPLLVSAVKIPNSESTRIVGMSRVGSSVRMAEALVCWRSWHIKITDFSSQPTEMIC